MSSMDPSFQSREMVYHLRQRGAEQIGQATAGIGGLAVDQARYMQDLAIRKAESEAKLQNWAVDRAIGQQKLMEMQMVDQAEMSRLQIEGLRAQTDSAKLALQQQQQAMQYRDPKEEAWLRHEAMWNSAFGDPLEAARRGMVRDRSTGRTRVGTEEEIKAEIDRQMGYERQVGDARRRYLQNTAGRDLGAATNNIEVMLRQLSTEARDLEGKKDDASVKRLEAIRRQRDGLLEELNVARQSIMGGGAPHPSFSIENSGVTGIDSGATVSALYEAFDRHGIADKDKPLVDQPGVLRAFEHYVAIHAAQRAASGNYTPEGARRSAYLDAVRRLEQGDPELIAWLREASKTGLDKFMGAQNSPGESSVHLRR